MESIKFTDWQKLDIRLGEILEVKDHPSASKLYIFKVNIGDKEINLVAGLKEHYAPAELIGKKIVVFVNLEPKEIKGIKSEGMVLAAQDSKHNISLLTINDYCESGAKIQ